MVAPFWRRATRGSGILPFPMAPDRRRFRPFAAAVALTAALQKLYPDDLQFLGGIYEFNDTIPAFDLLAGNSAIRTSILDGCDAASLIASWETDERTFTETKKHYHLYQ